MNEKIEKWRIENLPRNQEFDKFISWEVEKEIIKKYKEQIASYSDEEVKEFNKKIEMLLDPDTFEMPPDYRRAIAYFFLKLHVMEDEFIIK